MEEPSSTEADGVEEDVYNIRPPTLAEDKEFRETMNEYFRMKQKLAQMILDHLGYYFGREGHVTIGIDPDGEFMPFPYVRDYQMKSMSMLNGYALAFGYEPDEMTLLRSTINAEMSKDALMQSMLQMALEVIPHKQFIEFDVDSGLLSMISSDIPIQPVQEPPIDDKAGYS